MTVEPAWSPPDEFEEYRVVRLLGRGAMGEVYLARDSLLDRPVAVKFVNAAEDPEARARFFEEARAIAKLQHPNVVAIYRVAEIARHPYLVSEYVHGRTLDQLERPLPWRRVLELALDLSRGLAAAHRCGVLHGDVKPANAMLTDEGRAKLLDFGLARVVDDSADDAVLAPPRERSCDAGRSGNHLAAIDATLPGRRPPTRPEPDDDDDDDGSLDPLTSSTGSASKVARGSSGARHGLAAGAMGTPLYMAPEVWRGEPATRRADLYSLGISLYELLTGTAPHRGIAMAELAEAVQSRDLPLLGDIDPAIDRAFAAIVDKLVERDPGARYGSADALLVALEECAAPTPRDALPDGNPYRGLAAFDSAHGSLFFGRRGEIRELVDRVRTEAFVVVGGDSGTGKSSLCRAGVLPWLAEHGGWSRVEVVPGRHPVRTFAAALAEWTGVDEGELARLLRETPDSFARAIRQNIAGDRGAGPTRRLLLFVDQLEELLTLAAPDEARAVALALAALAVRTPWVRVLTTARSDFLSRLAMLPGLGDEMARGLYFLRPLTGERIREVIVRPAAAKGVAYESEALVDALVEQTEHAPGGLPLLQFTLAELWDAQDRDARIIRASALDALGGVAGALTSHADRLLDGLSGDEREAARRVLLRLVTAERTRARRSEAELVRDGPGRDAERAALEALVRGRVVVANQAEDGGYEIAHEALLSSWSTLQDWLQRGAVDHAARARIEQAAAAWQREGKPRDLLWRRRQLAEVNTLDRDSLAPREAEFLAAARNAIRARWMLGAGGAALLAIGAVVIGVTIRANARRDLERVVTTQILSAVTKQTQARLIGVERDVRRERAFALFDRRRWAEGEDEWTVVDDRRLDESTAYRAALRFVEGAMALAPDRDELRHWFADLKLERLQRAELDHESGVADLFDEVLEMDAGRHREALRAPAQIALAVEPVGTRVTIERKGATPQVVGRAPLMPLKVPPGSLVLVFEAPGRVPARLPVLAARGERLSFQIALPDAATAPRGMLYVPRGRFLFGSADDSAQRLGFFNAAPLHQVVTDPYYIGEHEVTFADWIAYLEDLPEAERRRRSPNAISAAAMLKLTELGSGRWRLELRPTTRTYVAETGQRFRYDVRTRNADQDWTRFPVAAISFEDSEAYVAWLAGTGRMPGARLCSDHEWERAARGADARLFPTGDRLLRGEANFDETYGREPHAFGPDEVGLHPASRSPVGAHDMAGNVWEWTRSAIKPSDPVTRGGSWYQAASSSRSVNREPSETSERHPFMGLRICATPQ